MESEAKRSGWNGSGISSVRGHRLESRCNENAHERQCFKAAASH